MMYSNRISSPLSAGLAATLEVGGRLSADQQQELAQHEASLLGLTLEQATALAHRDALPTSPLGMELRDLILHLRLPVPA